MKNYTQSHKNKIHIKKNFLYITLSSLYCPEKIPYLFYEINELRNFLFHGQLDSRARRQQLFSKLITNLFSINTNYSSHTKKFKICNKIKKRKKSINFQTMKTIKIPIREKITLNRLGRSKKKNFFLWNSFTTSDYT